MLLFRQSEKIVGHPPIDEEVVVVASYTLLVLHGISKQVSLKRGYGLYKTLMNAMFLFV